MAIEGADGNSGGRQSVKLAHEHLRQEILSGRIAAGSVLSQVQLAEQLSISRIPLREALRLLEWEGLIKSEVNRRVRVMPFSVQDLDQLYAMRIELEALGVRLTLPRLAEKDLAELEESVAKMDERAMQQDYEGWELPHQAFHASLVAGAGDRLVGTISQLSDHAERYRRSFMTSTPHSWQTSMLEHREILDACKEGDPGAAARRLARHYATVSIGLIATLAPEYDPVAARTALRTVTGE